MNLKDTFKSDLNTFFNPTEFGDLHTIDGVEVVLVIDDDLLAERKNKGSSHSGEGLYRGEKIFHVSCDALKVRPVIGEIMKFNHKRYRVFEVEENEGMLTITLEGHLS